MNSTRRSFLQTVGGAVAAGAVLQPQTALASAHETPLSDETMGVLVDLSNCVGCRLCEYACKEGNGIDPGPLSSYDDQSVFAQMRRPGTDCYTVVNAWPPTATKPADNAPKPVYAKVNCMHCNHAACVSACIVGALQKQDNGAVTYDAWKCIGCRYCMVACPFQIPAYEYHDVLTPEVVKCEFCNSKQSEGKRPSCVEACPREVMTFGKRSELLKLAHERIGQHPERYVDHVYGEQEVGGTSWLYLSSVPFAQAGFLPLGPKAPPALTESIQHGVFKYWIAPVGWYGVLSFLMWKTGRAAKKVASVATSHAEQRQAKPMNGHTVSLPVMQQPLAAATAGGGAAGISLPWNAPSHRPEYPSSRKPAADTHHADAHDEHHGEHAAAAPVGGTLWTKGTMFLAAVVGVGLVALLYRFLFGLDAATNLDQQHPWGLWIAMDVGSGIALAGGGFVTAFLVHVLHREHYHAVARSALLTALLGYTFYVPGLLADIGRWYNIWHPNLPSMWQGNSVLFEVGICVMIYLNVQYAEIAPIVCERILQVKKDGRIAMWAKRVHDGLEKIMPALLVLGVCLSTFHQSSLGNLMVIAPYKLHELWWTPVSPVLFLLSAMMVGLPMVIFTMLFASWSLKREPEMHVLAPLSRYVPWILAAYLLVRVGDVIVRGVYVDLWTDAWHGPLWLAEVLGGAVLPLALLMQKRVRQDPRWLGAACLMVIFGVVLNRLNVFVLAYHPPFAQNSYFPSLTEFALSAGLVAALLLTYRVAVTYLPILEPRPTVQARH